MMSVRWVGCCWRLCTRHLTLYRYARSDGAANILWNADVHRNITRSQEPHSMVRYRHSPHSAPSRRSSLEEDKRRCFHDHGLFSFPPLSFSIERAPSSKYPSPSLAKDRLETNHRPTHASSIKQSILPCHKSGSAGWTFFLERQLKCSLGIICVLIWHDDFKGKKDGELSIFVSFVTIGRFYLMLFRLSWGLESRYPGTLTVCICPFGDGRSVRLPGRCRCGRWSCRGGRWMSRCRRWNSSWRLLCG